MSREVWKFFDKALDEIKNGGARKELIRLWKEATDEKLARRIILPDLGETG